MSLKKRLVAYMKEDWRFPANIEADGLADEMKETIGNPDEDARNIMARLEFAINLRSKLRENYPNLISYVLDETMTLIAM